MSSPCTISPVAMPSPYTIYCIYSSYRCKWPFPCPLHGMRMWPCHHHSPLDTMKKCPSLSPFREMGKVAITIPLSMMILQYSNIERYKKALKAQKSYKSSGVSYPPSEKWDRWSSQFLIWWWYFNISIQGNTKKLWKYKKALKALVSAALMLYDIVIYIKCIMYHIVNTCWW